MPTATTTAALPQQRSHPADTPLQSARTASAGTPPTGKDGTKTTKSGWFANRKVRTKILAAVGIMALVAVASTIVGLTALSASNDNLAELTNTQNDVMAPLSLIHQNELKARADGDGDHRPDGR